MTTAAIASVIDDGVPVTRLYPGWEPISRHEMVGGLDVVLLREQNGREACWWVDHTTGKHMGSHVMALDPDRQNSFLTALDPVFWPLAEGVLKGTPRPKEGMLAPDLPQTAVLETAGSWISRHTPHTLLLLTGHADSGEALTCPDGKVIAEGRIRTLMRTKRVGETLILVSPFSAFPLRAQLVMRSGSLTAYRFHDVQEDAVFYITWNDNTPQSRPSFYYPAGPLLISDDPEGAFIPARILSWYALNQNHEDALRNALPFRPEDFGVGQASKLRQSPVTPTQEKIATSEAPATHTETTWPESKANAAREPSSTASSFLPDISSTDVLSISRPYEEDRGLFARLKQLFGRRTEGK